MREIRLELAQSLVLLFCMFAFGDIDMSSDHLAELSIGGKQRVAGRFYIFDRSIRK